MKHNIRCEKCRKKFYSSIGKKHCRKCSIELGLVKPTSLHQSMLKKMKTLCKDVHVYKTDIQLLAVKLKWGLLTPTDFFRVADIFMDVTCNDRIYSTRETYQQVELMIRDLVNLLQYKKHSRKLSPGKSKSIVQLNKEGEVVKTFPSIRQAKAELNCSDKTILKACAGEKTYLKEILKWSSDINI